MRVGYRSQADADQPLVHRVRRKGARHGGAPKQRLVLGVDHDLIDPVRGHKRLIVVPGVLLRGHRELLQVADARLLLRLGLHLRRSGHLTRLAASGGQAMIAAMILLIAVAFVVVVWAMASRYKKIPPNQVGIFYGRKYKYLDADGKLQHRVVSPDQARLLQRAIANYREIHSLLARWEEETASEILSPTPENQPK